MSRGRVLVTGATGCVGRFALPRLVEHGWDVCAVHSKSDRPSGTDVTWLRANLLERGDVDRVVRESEATHLLHLAWNIEPGRWATSAENVSWVRGSLDLLTCFRAAGGRRAVVAGSCLEYDWSYGYCSEDRTPLNAHTVYGKCKHALRLMLETLGTGGDFSSAWGRIFFLYGPGEHPDRLVASVIRSVIGGQAAKTSHGRQIRDYLYADDVAGAFVHLLESDFNGPVNIASGQPIALRDIVIRIGELMGRPELIEFGAIPAAPTDTALVVADTTRLNATLGWTPGWDLTRGLQASIDWWRRQ